MPRARRGRRPSRRLIGLVAADPTEPEAWLRTPGLLRLATALLHQNRPAVAAMLLQGGAKRRTQDGLPLVNDKVGVGVAYSIADDTVRVTELLHPERRKDESGEIDSSFILHPSSLVKPGDLILKVNDTELTRDSLEKFDQLLSGEVGTKVRLTVRHSGSEKPAVIELTRERFVNDPATGDLLVPLRALVNERLAKAPRDARLLELRAELAGQWSGSEAQVADYSAAMEGLAHQTAKAAADLKRLYRRRGNAYVSLKKWAEALDDYAHVVTDTTTDEDLISNRARAYEALRNWEAAAADWSRATAGNPDRAKLLAEFARRLAAGGQVPLAKAQFEKSQALYERRLEAEPENDQVAAELAQLLYDKEANERRTRWTVLKPSETKSKGGATLSKLPDESILASGKNPLGDAYTIVAPTPVTPVRAIRLEALTHESLPNQGPGRSEKTSGGFAMVNFKITAHIPGTQPRPIEVSRVAADHYSFGLTANYWNIEGGQARPHTAVYLARQPVDCKDGTRLEVKLEFSASAEWPLQNLGRFRLSVSSDRAAFDGEQTRFAAMKLTDPWAKLAVAYAVNGRNDEATRYFTRALERSEGREARKPILELAARFGDLLPALIERHPDEPQLQLALARKLAARGQQRLAEKRLAEAQTELEKCREIYTRLQSRLPAHNRAALRMDLTENDVVDLSVALAKAYHAKGDQPPLDRLLQAHPTAVAGIGDLYAVDKKWDRAVAEYTKAITPETTFAKLLAKRAEAYEKLKQWDLAVADWTRASQQQPDVAFQRFKPVGAGSWRFETWNGGAGSMEVADGTLVFTTTVATGTGWHVQAIQGGLQLENGAEYVIRFKMKSPDSCTVTLLGSINEEDWHGIGLNETFVPPSAFRVYEFTFVPHDVVPGNNRIVFEVGTNRGKVMVKEIVILKK